MRKKIDVQQLEIGMYVAELDRPWLGTPFLFQGFTINSPEEIAELKRYCKSVYIDLLDDIDESKIASKRTGIANRPVPTEAEQRVARDFLKIINHPSAQSTYGDQTTLEQEISEVRDDHEQARTLVYQLMDDARHGKSLDSITAKKVVAGLAESVIRNPDALTCFTQLKRKDEYTALHSLRVCILALAFVRHLGLDKAALNTLGIGALLHDIGKMAVPTDILHKPGALDDREFNLMKSHVPKGVEILERTANIPPQAIEVARCHHERHSGTGYIGGLKGDEIGVFGMIGGIVDCYDAITSDRAYQQGMSAHTALKKMYEWRARDFHPRMVEQFIQCMGIYPIGCIVELNTGEIGVVVTMNRVRRLKPRVRIVLNADYKPYPTPITIDLMQQRTNDGRSYDIERVLEPGVYGINPVHYLPVQTGDATAVLKNVLGTPPLKRPLR